MRTLATAVATSTLVVVGLAGTAWASSLALDSDPLGAGGAVVGRCDATGATFSYSVSPTSADPSTYRVDAVVLGSVDAACDGGAVSLTLTDAAGAPLASVSRAPFSVSNGTATVAVPSGPLSTAVKGVHVLVQR